MDNHRFKENIKLQPTERSSNLSQIFFGWSLPLFYNRYKNEVTEEEHYAPLRNHESRNLGNKLEKAWRDECVASSNPSLRRALWRVFHVEFLSLGSLCILFEFIKLSQPWLIGKLVSQYDIDTETSYFYALFVLVNSFLSVLIGHNYTIQIKHLGLKMKTACCSLIYRKALKINKTTLADVSTGKIVNLISNDVNRLDLTPMYILQVIVAPVELIFVISCLSLTVGATATAGIVFLMIFTPFQTYVSSLTAKFRLKTASLTDQRVKLINEIIKGVQVIKMYTWEKLFANKVKKCRKLEIRQIWKSSCIKALNLSFAVFINRTGIYCCVILYAITQKKIDALYVFTVSAFYSILRQALTVYLPFGISNIAETRVSIGRIEDFLASDEVPSKPLIETDENDAVCLKNVSVKWLATSPDYSLQSINFEASSSELVGVTGPVGSGKSTLLYTILEELPLLQGQMAIRGSLSYASQEPWLFSGSIRQNILFREKFNLGKYKTVVRICGLEEDFSTFPESDGSVVGENGVLLSGGQKARINLARAIYRDADIYLLDDPFAAIDVKVGKKIFQECLLEYLKGKCTILATHHLHYLGKADKIYTIGHGKIEKLDTNINGYHVSEENADDSETEIVGKLNTKPAEMREERKTGTISSKVYQKYIEAGGNYATIILLFLLFFSTQLGASGVDYFLAFWVNLEQSREAPTLFTHQNCIYIYSIILILTIFVSITRSLAFLKFCNKASHNLHNKMLSQIIEAPLTFFNVNPTGRILNRFSKDIGFVDENLPVIIMETFQIAFLVLGSTILVTIINPLLLIPTIIMLTIFYFFKIVYLATSQNLKRLEATNRSPIYTFVNTSLQGLTTIRSHKAQKLVRKEFDYYQNLYTSTFYMCMICEQAFGFWLDMTCVFYSVVAIVSIVMQETSVGNIGLGITQSISLIGLLQWGIKQWSQLENQMVSVERLIEYTEISPEMKSWDNEKFHQNWPSRGHIEFKSVSLQHSLNEILHEISFDINPNEKIGIVGRTGAGKSSLISVLFRLFHFEGNILIDGVNITHVPLNLLRSRISVIPQEPQLFSGTLRENLDPFKVFDDAELWQVLEKVELKNAVSSLPHGLSSEIVECGSNFSVGQRQLLCLARAILKNNKILILDEATANVDQGTDSSIQKTIKQNFENCTVLTIAHRLHSVMDSDRILIIDGGKVIEFDHPYNLIKNSNSMFGQFVQESGDEMAKHLSNVAKENYQNKYEKEKYL